MLQGTRCFREVPPPPGPDYYLKLDEHGGYYWQRNTPSWHLWPLLAFNFGTFAFFAWVLWQSIP